MPKPVGIGGLRIDDKLYALVRDEIAPGTGIEPDAFWSALSQIVHALGLTNRALLDKRNVLQRQIDSWCLRHRGQPFNVAEYQAFLETIGYLVRDGENFQVATENVDREIAGVSGPQLVVALDNARYASMPPMPVGKFMRRALWRGYHRGLECQALITQVPSYDSSGRPYSPRRRWPRCVQRSAAGEGNRVKENFYATTESR